MAPSSARDEFLLVETLFHELQDLDATLRAQRLNAQPPTVRERVLRLLDAASREQEEAIATRPERVFGPYQALALIGRGGMGEVWRAQRTDGVYSAQVAIKTLRSPLAPEEFYHRFRLERQILATLEHPNIARLLDGGVTAPGTPYLVMELVEGEPLLQYARRQAPTVSAKAALLEQAAHAIAYAHRNLVLHRDLKPANLLVTHAGMVKLLDFGTAKLVEPATESESGSARTTLARAFTPQYASPEQVLGRPTSVATDVWGLGVLLYELLKGEPPFTLNQNSLEELIAEVCEKDAPAARIDPDLDSIIAKALRRDPAERYQRVEDLLADLAAWREGRPVLARRGGWRYRLAKFARRRRRALAAAAVMLSLAAAGAASTLYQARLASERYSAMRDLTKSLLNELLILLQRTPGTLEAQRLLVARTLQALDPLAARAGNDSELRLELARAYHRAGSLQGDPYFHNTGDPQGALVSLLKAEQLLPEVPGAAELRSAIHGTRSGVLQVLNRPAEAEAEIRRALKWLERAPRSPRALRGDGNLRLTLGDLVARRDPAEASRLYEQSAARAAEADRLDPRDPERTPTAASLAFIKQGNLWLERDPQRALAEYRKGLAAFHALAPPIRQADPRIEANLLRKEGNALAALRQFGPALAAHRASLAISERLLALDPADKRSQYDLAVNLNDLALVLESSGNGAECLRLTDRALALLAPLARSAGPRSAYAAALAEVEERAARLRK